MLKIYNTMARELEEFRPRNGKNVKIFTCGPSIYQKAHLGNYRTFLYEDLLVRYLKFSGYHVERAMNLTDIEDKTISEAKKKGVAVHELTGDVLAIFRDSLDGFDFVMPEHLIPATESIDSTVKIIKTLVEKGIAYELDGDYFFDPLKIDNFGKLFQLDMKRWPKEKRRFRRDTYNGNRWNLGDFILWHADGEEYGPVWDTEIGKGRPSWNIQDPAIVIMTLGDQVDINCGGIDNIYRHHDYNIAVMEGYSGKDYANYYMHGEHLVVDGISMSKSRGNIVYPEDLVKKGHSWKEIRFFLTYRHYRKKLNYTEEHFNKTVKILHDFRNAIDSVKGGGKEDSIAAGELIDSINPAFSEQLDKDLSLGKGFDAVHTIIKKLEKISKAEALSENQLKSLESELKKIDNVINVIYPT